MKIRWEESDVYGHKAILREYARIGKWRRSTAAMQHGWTPTIHGYLANKEPGRLETSLVWNQRDLRRHQQAGIKSDSVGAPFLYLVHLFEQQGHGVFRDCSTSSSHTKRKNQTLVYCPHNWVGEPDHENVLGYIRSVLETRSDPLTFVLHSFDFTNENVQLGIRELGVEAISHSSSTFDPCGTHNQLLTLLEATEVLCGYLGTPLMYSAFLGKRCQLFNQTTEDELAVTFGTTFSDQNEILEIAEIFRGGIEGEYAQRIGREELGADYFRSPAEIRSIFGWEIRSQLNVLRRKIVGRDS